VNSRSERVAILAVALTAGLFLTYCSGSPKETGTSTPPEETSAVDTAATAPDEPTAPEAEATGESGEEGQPVFEPSRATGAVEGVPAPTNTVPIVAVANYYTELPGFDLGKLTPRQKEKFLQRVNSEMCTCGCKNDTLARCQVNDPNCPVVKGMVQKVYDEVKSVR